MDKYKEKIVGLQNEFQNGFQIFNELEKEVSLFRSPFTASTTDVPEELHMELMELQCNTPLKDKFATVTVDLFDQNLGPTKILSMFGTTYLSEQAFSEMNINKSNLRSRLTHRHLNDIMRVATAQNLLADVDALVEEKRCQVSGSKN